VLLLAIDTCDARGGVSLLRDNDLLASASHTVPEDYSSWLLPAAEGVLAQANVRMTDLDGFGVAAGPGSFTGVRIGLTTVKGWAEVYKKPIAAVSRLEAVAAQAQNGTRYVAASLDAQRGQVFGAVYQRNSEGLVRLGDEMVIGPGKFVVSAAELANGERITWLSTDPDCLENVPEWQERAKLHEAIEPVPGFLAPMIARMAAAALAAGGQTDALHLDANYVRRSDAEIFWKGSAHAR